MTQRGRVFFVNRFYYPDFSATAQILTDVAEGLAAMGWDAHIITSRLLYGGGDKLPKSETINAVSIHRISTTSFGRAGLIGRAMDYMSFYISSMFSVLKHARKGDVFVIKTDPPMLGALLGVMARIKGARRVNWLQDIYPEVAGALGVKLATSWIGGLLCSIRDRSLRSANKTVVISEGMAAMVAGKRVPPNDIVLLQNFTDDTAIQPLALIENPLRTEWGYADDDFVIGYSGNLGRAHDLDTMLGAAERLASNPKIKFLFIGGGHLRQTLEDAIEARGLTNIETKPYQPREKLNLSLTVADIHWASLLPSMEALILPSKLYGIAAAGRPLLMVGNPDGDIGTILKRREFGNTVSVGDSEGFATAVLELANDRAQYELYAANARGFIDEEASRAHIIKSWDEMLSAL